MNVAAVTSAGQLRRQFAARLANVFASEGREGTAALDARLLLAHALEVDATRLALCDDDPVDPRTEALATALIDRRIAGEPVARIVGKSAFWGMEFDIGAQTLVPRPDSETLVEAALAFVDRRGWRERTLDLLDLGTGSGILLLALLSELPGATGIATDVEPGAILVAHRNAMRLNLADRAMFAVGNWGDALCGGFDLVLANPPYIESAQIGGLQVEVARHDPHMALDGGADGLDAIRAIFSDLDRLLARNGHGFVEIGRGQTCHVVKMAENKGFSTLLHRDLGGIERIVEVWRLTESRENRRSCSDRLKNGLGNSGRSG